MTTPPPPAPGADRSPDDDPQLQELKRDLARRLRGPCGHLDAEAFDALVHDMAVTKLRWAQRYGRAL